MEFINMCRKYGLFTCGSCAQYDEVIERFCDSFCEDRPFVAWGDYIQIVAMTYICSDMEEFNYGQVSQYVMELVEALGYLRDASGDFVNKN